jgi:hypothetical protein
MDMAAAAEITCITRMRRYLAAHRGWAGVPLARAALDLADEGSRSPNETRLRLIWVLDCGFPRPLVNQPVWDLDGRLLGYPDLLDPVLGVVAEYDGADHRDAGRHSDDIDRERAMRDQGLEFFRVTGRNLRDRVVVVRRMQAARAAAASNRQRRRTWTIRPPEGWRGELPLDLRLEQRDELRAWDRDGPPDLKDIIGW